MQFSLVGSRFRLDFFCCFVLSTRGSPTPLPQGSSLQQQPLIYFWSAEGAAVPGLP